MQKVFICETRSSDLRCRIDGWSAENGDEVCIARLERSSHASDVPVGHVRSMTFPPPWGRPETILHALGDGWKLLAPPVKLDKDLYEWWLVKD